MIGTISEIVDNNVFIKLSIDIAKQPNLVGLHVVFDDGKKYVVGEVANTNRETMTVNIVGEIKDGYFVPGSSQKPSFSSNPRLIKTEELAILLGEQETKHGQSNFGTSNVYEGYKINVAINEFFNAHFCILGNSGSGKSCTVASILQKLFVSSPTPPTSAGLFFFDAYGEYTNAFSKLHEHSSSLNYKAYTTNLDEPEGELLRLPIWLLDVDDLALLLDVTTPAQLPILEKTLKLVPILTGNGESVIKKKNDIIARALQDILLSGNDSTKIRDQVIGVLTKFNTETLSLNSQIVQPGYTRTLKQCLFVDKTGKMQEMELVVEFVRGYIQDETTDVKPEEMNPHYSLSDLELAMEFALISEGILKSDKVFDYANVISVRLHTLVTSPNAAYFSYPNYVTLDQYLDDLQTSRETGGRCQIVNFNVNYIDDRLAKVFTKVLSRMLFKKSSSIKPRGSRAFHIIIEEAHRYVQHDGDVKLLGYNIFERIAKEGRKYGMFLGLITQRPSELSDTCVSQCMNFVILRTLHPIDLEYIRTMVPNVTSEIVLQLKNLKPGNCIAFGSAFKVPTQLYVDLPDPRPLSNNVNLENVWYKAPEVSSVAGVAATGFATAAAPQMVAMTQAPVAVQPQTTMITQPAGAPVVAPIMTQPQVAAAPQAAVVQPVQQPQFVQSQQTEILSA